MEGSTGPRCPRRTSSGAAGPRCWGGITRPRPALAAPSGNRPCIRGRTAARQRCPGSCGFGRHAGGSFRRHQSAASRVTGVCSGAPLGRWLFPRLRFGGSPEGNVDETAAGALEMGSPVRIGPEQVCPVLTRLGEGKLQGMARVDSTRRCGPGCGNRPLGARRKNGAAVPRLPRSPAFGGGWTGAGRRMTRWAGGDGHQGRPPPHGP